VRLPDGETGEICVKGLAVLRRYYKVDPAETFDAEGFFRTGDLGHVDAEGRLHFGQRIKDMIKTGGINVSPADVEAQLARIDGIAAAYAFPLPSPEKGEVVGAALVVAAGADPSDEDVLSACRERLSGYKRPEAVLLVSEAQVPMTGSGKVQKAVLRDRLLAARSTSAAPVVRLAEGLVA